MLLSLAVEINYRNILAFFSFLFLTIFYYFSLISRSGAGNHYGTFSGPVEAFSAAQKDKKSYQSPGKNFITNPPKKGTGFGYINVTIGHTPKYTADPYDRAKEIRNVRHYL